VDRDAQRGKRVKEERERLGLSQQQIADAAGVRREMWAKYEAGAEPGAKALAGAAIAGADVLYILTGQRGAVPLAPVLAPDEAALLDNYRNSPPAGRDALKATSAALAQSCSTTKRRAG